jgi:hypothetical protein
MHSLVLLLNGVLTLTRQFHGYEVIMRFLLLLMVSLSLGIDDVTLPIDFRTITPGKPSYIADNDEEIRDKFNASADSLTQIRARFSNYTTSFTMTSEENGIIKIDNDATGDLKFFVLNGTNDTMFWAAEDSSFKIFGDLTVGGSFSGSGGTTFTDKVDVQDSLEVDSLATFNDAVSIAGDLSVGGKVTVTDSLVVNGYIAANFPATFYEDASFESEVFLNNLSASQAVFTFSDKRLVSNPITGSGSVVMSTGADIGSMAMDTLTVDSLLTQNGKSIFTGDTSDYIEFDFDTQGYQWTGTGGALKLRNKGATSATNLYLFNADGTGSYDNEVSIFGFSEGLWPLTNRHRLSMGWFNSSGTYDIYTENAGSQGLQNLRLYVEGNANQLVLDSTGFVSFSGEIHAADDITLSSGKTLGQTNSGGLSFDGSNNADFTGTVTCLGATLNGNSSLNNGSLLLNAVSEIGGTVDAGLSFVNGDGNAAFSDSLTVNGVFLGKDAAVFEDSIYVTSTSNHQGRASFFDSLIISDNVNLILATSGGQPDSFFTTISGNEIRFTGDIWESTQGKGVFVFQNENVASSKIEFRIRNANNGSELEIQGVDGSTNMNLITTNALSVGGGGDLSMVFTSDDQVQMKDFFSIGGYGSRAAAEQTETAPVLIGNYTSETSTVDYAVNFVHGSSVKVGPGFGVGNSFWAKNNTGVGPVPENILKIGDFNFNYTDTTNNLEDAEFIVRVIDGGTLFEVLDIDGDGFSTPLPLTSTSLSTGDESFTYDEGSFTAEYNGFSGSVTGDASWTRIGNIVHISFKPASGTSDSTGFSISNIPSALTTSKDTDDGLLINVFDNGGTAITEYARFDGSGKIGITFGGSTTGFTASGTKGINGNTITYNLDL